MWEVLLDIDQLAISEGEDWLLNATASLPGTHGRTMLSLSRRGSDAVTLREFDIDANAFARDSFVLPEAKRDAEWIDPDTLVLSSSYGAGYGDDIWLCAHGAAVAARHGGRSNSGDL